MSNRSSKTLEKLLKASQATTQQGQLNFITDALHESGRTDSQQDKMMHFIIEMMTGTGTATDRFVRWSKKTRKYRR